MINAEIVGATIEALEAYVDLLAADGNRDEAGQVCTVLNFWRMYQNLTKNLEK